MPGRERKIDRTKKPIGGDVTYTRAVTPISGGRPMESARGLMDSPRPLNVPRPPTRRI